MNFLNVLSAKTGAAKLDYLATADDKVKDILVYTYNDNIYGLKFKDDELNFGSMRELGNVAISILVALKNRTLTGYSARERVNDYCMINGDTLKFICNKNIQCGISVTSINKVFPGLIPQFKVQLAKAEKDLSKLKFPLLAQLKYDGVRIVIIWNGDSVVFKTRNGREIFLPYISRRLKDNFEEIVAQPCIIDTEVTLYAGTTEDRAAVSGLINSARQKKPILEQKLVFNCFDCMPLDDFNNAECLMTYQHRLAILNHIIVELEVRTEAPCYLLKANTTTVLSFEEVNILMADTLEQNQEGLILKTPEHLYTFKRSKDWIKLKAVLDADITCIDIVEGTGKYQGMIGALVCEGVVEGMQITVNVGTGLSDMDRARVAFDSDKSVHSLYLGSIIEVQYNSLIQNSVTGNWSLFLPRFICMRTDK